MMNMWTITSKLHLFTEFIGMSRLLYDTRVGF